MTEKDAYAKAGVDIGAGTQFIEMMKERFAKAWPGAERNIGGFAGTVPVPRGSQSMVASTDGVGTKLILAAAMDMFDGIGRDAVAMSAVDSYVAGTKPKYLLDYFATGCLDPEKHIRIIDSLIAGCYDAGCQIIGGETAEMPGFFKHNWFVDLVTFVVGFDDEPKTFDEEPREYSPLKVGQKVYGWPSYGPASNGFSLLRKVHGLNTSPSKMRRKLESRSLMGRPLAEALLAPTPIWIKELERQRANGVKFSGHVHVTGGGLIDNPPRILPSYLKMVIGRNFWNRPKIFYFTQELGNISQSDMDRTFNNGIMMISVVSDDGMPMVSSKAIEIGVIEKRKGDEPQSELFDKYRS
jgi:phosphoribosylformylglycinamidine cyclo-ligase